MIKGYKNVPDAVNQLDPEHLISSYTKEIEKPFHESLSQESDRAIAIIVGCLLDTLLEKLIRAYFIKDKEVNKIFTDDHILQSLYSKIQIAYFSSLIAKPIYHDLIKICNIRNKFAHDVTANLSFSNKSISQIINNCELRPKELDDIYSTELDESTCIRIKYVIVVQQILDNLCYSEQLLLRDKLPYPVEYFGLDKMPYDKMALSKSEILKHIEMRNNI